MRKIHLWTNAMGGVEYVFGYPVAACEMTLCGFYDHQHVDCTMTDEAVTCRRCLKLLRAGEGIHRLPATTRKYLSTHLR